MPYSNVAGTHTKIIAAQTLLLEPTTSKEKFAHIHTLLKGINPQLDTALERCADGLATLDKVLHGDVISLSADNLPEQTEEEKRRKRALVLFLGSWNKLKGEVARVEKELAAAESAGTTEARVSGWRKIGNFAKGPFGIITIVAVAIVLTMQAVSVKVTITNQGCDTIVPDVPLPFSLPGLSLPKEPIPSGGSASATVPGLTVTVDATQSGTLTATTLGYSMDFELSGMDDVQFDGATLLGKETTIRLSEKKEHELVLACR
ncbi:hypothetical protein A2763_01765 [Candidatus Kaiserbacteria bacterium RIFCSPHIGHO2_01_FULL_54_36]|uniref:Uncharacterized protein n=1 Tax=Candidatus Kaiserbacteria bacterium RIFCSPHIGHO2_01_FULL_54_36 TaxID=1798482 RepID=A0A1F6CLM4_9BACT|nr:MAG: hypothetical protein A2763_01765 [Candidatus Kaiserbacteria bacterium RIFCSPHIGHO2_01_FULL_54_36]OGG75739.1 MAG: hypothetical protein A3A41_01940 [Candidatus Kaiserbacteria bacterium RIFCSPLOWO2_01_FULL_54_22]